MDRLGAAIATRHTIKSTFIIASTVVLKVIVQGNQGVRVIGRPRKWKRVTNELYENTAIG